MLGALHNVPENGRIGGRRSRDRVVPARGARDGCSPLLLRGASGRDTRVTVVPQPLARPIRLWRSLSLATRLAMLGLLCGWVLPTIIMRSIGWDASYWQALTWLEWRGRLNDSSVPIKAALDYIGANPADGLYEATYYKATHQFIYSPLSLVFYKLTGLLPSVDWQSVPAMNRTSWWFVLAAIVAVAAIFASKRQILGPACRTSQPLDTIVRATIGLVAAILFVPMTAPYYHGNIQSWINFALILSLLLFIHGNRIIVGVLLGLCCIIKPSWSLILVWFLLRREYRVVAGMLGVVVVFGVASIALYGLQVQFEYLKLLGYLSKRGESYYANQSINGLLNRMLFLGNNLEWDGSHTKLPYNALVHTATTVTSLAMLAACLVPWRRIDRHGTVLGFCIALMTFLLASPVVYEHYYAIVLPICFIALVYASAEARLNKWAVGSLLLAYALCGNVISGVNALAPTGWNFLQSYMLFGGLALLLLLYRAQATASTKRQIRGDLKPGHGGHT
jgi:hypothetical protein